MAKFNKELTVTKEKNSTVETLRTIMSELYHINQRLEGVIHPDIHQKLVKLQEAAEEELKPVLESEQKSWDENFDALRKIQEENKLISIWSVSEVSASDMNKKTPLISKITYNYQTHTFKEPTELTWFEFWKIADELIRDSGDTHHIFVEGLYQEKQDKGTTNYRLMTGS